MGCDMDKIRILSLDGGGMRGIITARILLKVEKMLGGEPLNQHFNFIAGTSTGSLLAAGLAIGMRVQDLIDIYTKEGEVIFPYQKRYNPQRLPLLFEYGLSAPKFSNAGLIKTVKKHIGSNPDGTPRYLSHVGAQSGTPKLLITAYDTRGRDAVIFKSWRKDKWYNRDTVRDPVNPTRKTPLALWQACVSSASAPTYFPPLKVSAVSDTDADKDTKKEHEYSLIDGGVCANNPTACAVAEAIRLLCEPESEADSTSEMAELPSAQSPAEAIQNIKVLSIGTGDVTASLPWSTVRKWGLVQWGLRIADVLMDAPSDVHDYVSRQIISDPSPINGVDTRYLRLQLNRSILNDFNPEALKVEMDDARPHKLKILQGVAADYCAEQEKAIRLFLENLHH